MGRHHPTLFDAALCALGGKGGGELPALADCGLLLVCPIMSVSVVASTALPTERGGGGGGKVGGGTEGVSRCLTHRRKARQNAAMGPSLTQERP